MRLLPTAIPSLLPLFAAVGLVAQDGSGPTSSFVKAPEPPIHDGAPAVPPPPRALGEAATPHDHRKGLPPIPVGTGTLPLPDSPPTRGYDIAQPPEAPCDLRFQVDRVVKPTGAVTSLIGEPSVAQVRDTSLFTGNWYAARSMDSGQTWSFISPHTTFPAPDGAFCCDQRVLYIPSADITVWLLQYNYSATTLRGGQRIAIANGRADLRAGTTGSWHSWYFTPQDFGRPVAEWLDFPDIAYSNGHLYASANVYNAANVFTDAIVWRMPLAQLAAGGGLQVGFASSDNALAGGSSYRLTQNAAGIMYFACHRTTTLTRVYRWTDGSNTVAWTDLTVSDSSGVIGFQALAPNGVNWGGRADSRITGAWYKGSEYGFMWGCPPRGGRPQVYLRTIRIATATNTLLSTQDTWSDTYQFLYPAAAVNADLEIGCCAAIANSISLHPTTCFFMVDACQPSFSGQAVAWFTGGSSPATPNTWGDYFSLQRHSHYPSTFVGTGMTCRNGGTSDRSEPHYVWFCREADMPPTVQLVVTSTPVTGVPIGVDATDRSSLRDGSTNFTRVYNARQGYALTAPATFVSGTTTYLFHRWVLLGASQAIDQTVLDVDDIGTADDTAEALYLARRTLQVRSSNPTTGIAVTVSVVDINGAQNGTTAFDRLYKDGTVVTVTAPAWNGIHPFRHWVHNRTVLPDGQRALPVTMDANETVTAVYFTHVSGAFTQFCSGCPGTNGRVPAHSGLGTPEIGQAITWRVTNAVANAAGTVYLGASRTLYNGLPLPLNLGVIGMGPSCLLCVSPDVSLPFATNVGGAGGVALTLPTSTALIDSHLYTQAAVVDLGAGSTVPVVHTNGLDTLIGGTM